MYFLGGGSILEQCYCYINMFCNCNLLLVMKRFMGSSFTIYKRFTIFRNIHYLYHYSFHVILYDYSFE